jgi:hypothetical protein
MGDSRWLRLLVLLVTALSLNARADGVRINEFMASNQGGIRDEDGDTSAWIEIYNPGARAVDLGGWYLTDKADNLAKWQFPSFQLQAGAYFVLFASGKDRTNPAAPLHTNFKLAKSGGFVALVQPGGTNLASEFAFTQQFTNVSYGCAPSGPTQAGFCAYPTPGAPNSPVGAGFGPDVDFSVSSCTFQQGFSVALSTSDTNAVIRYFVVTNAVSAALTNVPDLTCPIYSDPIAINGPSIVRARSFPAQTNYFPGPVQSQMYLQITESAAQFTSLLPIVLFDNFGAGDVPVGSEQFAAMLVFEPTNGVSSMTNAPDLVTRAVYHRHGSSTLYDPKPNLGLKMQDESGGHNDQPLLGMPADSHWIFYGTDVYDKSALHNPLAHELFSEMGHYTSRTRFVEVYIRREPGTPAALTTAADYGGLYVIEEKIRIAKNRVDINRLQSSDTNAPDVTGGYLLSIDRQKTDDDGNPIPQLGAAGVEMNCLNPDYYTLASPTQMVQLQYLSDYFNAFYDALYSADWRDPTNGYAPYIDLSSWIDYHLHQVFVFNVDMLRLSSFFYKPRSGPFVQGPLWDFDRSFGTGAYGDYRGLDPWLWRSSELDGGTDAFNPGNTYNNPWYSQLFQDPDFFQKWIDRYQELRGGIYSLSNITYQINFLADQLSQAAPRDAARWAGQGQSDTSPRSGLVQALSDNYSYTFPTPGTYQGEVYFAKFWFTNRVHFIDTNFLAALQFSIGGGAITSGCALTLTSSTLETNSRIYYTLDGTDPRLPGGAASGAAFSALNTATITLTTNTQVFARNWNTNHHNLTGPGNPPLSSPWSGPATASFYIPPRFQSIAALPDGAVQLVISCQAGLPCSLEVSADLSTWLSLTNFPNPAGVFQFLDDSTAGSATRFYRAQQ